MSVIQQQAWIHETKRLRHFPGGGVSQWPITDKKVIPVKINLDKTYKRIMSLCQKAIEERYEG